MYITEEMISSMEDMQRNANEMEKHIKGMMETEARMHGLELDSRHNARDMWGQLYAHMANMTVAEPVMDDLDMAEEAIDTAPSEMEPAPAMVEHTHEDGTTHAHEGGDMEHTHDEPAIEEPAPAPVPDDGTTPHA